MDQRASRRPPPFDRFVNVSSTRSNAPRPGRGAIFLFWALPEGCAAPFGRGTFCYIHLMTDGAGLVDSLTSWHNDGRPGQKCPLFRLLRCYTEVIFRLKWGFSGLCHVRQKSRNAESPGIWTNYAANSREKKKIFLISLLLLEGSGVII